MGFAFERIFIYNDFGCKIGLASILRVVIYEWNIPDLYDSKGISGFQDDTLNITGRMNRERERERQRKRRSYI